jgi:hypothetical protein
MQFVLFVCCLNSVSGRAVHRLISCRAGEWRAVCVRGVQTWGCVRLDAVRE